MTLRSQTFTASGTFNVPANVSAVWVSAIAQGAGGGGCGTSLQNGAGGGGAGEQCSTVLVHVTPGGTLSFTMNGTVGVNSGGAGATSPTFVGTNVHRGPEGITGNFNGNGGADTVVGPIQCKGGYGGVGAATAPHSGMGGGPAAGPTSGNAGGGGTDCIDTAPGVGAGRQGLTPLTKCSGRWFAGAGGGSGGEGSGGIVNGGAGGPAAFNSGASGGTKSVVNCGGGAGASTQYGDGGTGGNGDNVGGSAGGTAYGSGGGGAGGGSGISNRAGGNGGGGFVVIAWTAP